MELHPEDSVGFVNAQGLPSEQTTEVTTNVIVRDGETILIGGLFREVTTDTRRQVPWLGGLPGIGTFFKSREDKTTREEVIILLTVHIVKDRAAYVADSLAMYEDLDRLRVGVRQGLMWHGRERVAQRQYHKATDAFARGDTEKALWHLNMALHNHPRFVPATQVKEQIRKKRDWDEETSGGRLFLHRLIARERGQVGPFFGRPGPSFEALDTSATDVAPNDSDS
jgi:type IV pilus assembly protein PilQ